MIHADYFLRNACLRSAYPEGPTGGSESYGGGGDYSAGPAARPRPGGVVLSGETSGAGSGNTGAPAGKNSRSGRQRAASKFRARMLRNHRLWTNHSRWAFAAFEVRLDQSACISAA